ncbi:hypothetical protein [Marinicella rhabdoformis]|uniref:hypothetical protein n=1 Tax=Marinicella rhabdoformis TaxID=2580566 RepID=UPI0012AECA13|nr:hypothetical protein [Marinicella rhabdoformis]
MKNLLFYAFFIFIAYKGWTHFVGSEIEMDKNENGFSDIYMPNNFKSDVVYIVAPKNCPKKAGKRADALELALKSRGVTVVRSNSVSINAIEPSEETISKIERSSTVLRGTIPAVFFNGMASSNPTADEVFAQWRG